MREIKFRAWDKRTEQMFDNDDFLNAGRALVRFAKRTIPNEPDMGNAKGGLLLCTDDESMVFMQYTGLKDDEGRDVYDGDFLKVIWSFDEISICQVVWSEDIGKWLFKDCADYYGKDDIVGARFEVIGNIYENPELLEGKNNG